MKRKLPKNGYHHGDLRRDLLRVARNEIARNGAQAVSLTSLATIAGVSQPAPYRHFADRDALFEALAAQGFEEISTAISEAAAGCAPEQAWRAMALAYVSYGETNIELYRLMFASRLVPEAKRGSDLAVAADRAFQLLRHAISAISTASSVDHEAHLLWSQLHGLVMLKADGFIEGSLLELTKLAISRNNKASGLAVNPVKGQRSRLANKS